MGAVWQATDSLLNRSVAVKLLHPAQMAEPTARERFRTEGRITAGLSHPGIAQVYDYGEQDDRAFIVMELVPGEPLSSILKRNEGLEPSITLDIISQSAAALAAAHVRGVIHRDIKPGNLLVTEDGAVKLTDFGIARGNESVTLTQTGMVMGTAQYISPEQASGRPATCASDIYALGVVAYECLAGRPPFTSDTPLALALAHTREPPPPLPEDIPEALRAFVLGLLEKDPANRPGSAGEVAQAAQRLRGVVDSDQGGATTAMNIADPGQTAVFGANGETSPQASGAVPAASRTGSYAATGAASARGADDGGDRVQPLPPSGGRRTGRRGRPSPPIVIAAVVAAVIVVVGVAIAGSLWNNQEAKGRPVVEQGLSPSTESSPSPSQDKSPPPVVEQQPEQDSDPGGYQEPERDTGGQSQSPGSEKSMSPGTGSSPGPGDQPDDDGGSDSGDSTTEPGNGGDNGNGGGNGDSGNGGDNGGGDGGGDNGGSDSGSGGDSGMSDPGGTL
ncbi:serine/threonine protein kinase [Nocardiopsis gilva YIM 90087]|uniref:non-specific serine/threonine protein kinase n=2 Tax=Nocardiopsis gilva TaxID=280236 RepID=A0A223SD27_9ACTN|nr:serine/threonine protein kinase [Nocardiopsis gilva YIM 90087]